MKNAKTSSITFIFSCLIAGGLLSCKTTTDSDDSSVESAREGGSHCKALEQSGEPSQILYTCQRIDRTHSGIEGGVIKAGSLFGFSYVILPGALPPGMSVPPPEQFTACGKVKSNTEDKFSMTFTTMNGTLTLTKLSTPGTYKGVLTSGKHTDEMSCTKGTKFD